jgi:hypothetical protein
MALFTNPNEEQSRETLVDMQGKSWGVFNRPGTGVFYAACYKLDDKGNINIDNRFVAPPECNGLWTNRTSALEAIKLFLAREFKYETTTRYVQKTRDAIARKADAADPG